MCYWCGPRSPLHQIFVSVWWLPFICVAAPVAAADAIAFLFVAVVVVIVGVVMVFVVVVLAVFIVVTREN